MIETAQNQTNLDIFSTLRKELLNLIIKPGEQIQESAICKRFNSSRPTVRTAFQRLKDQGLVDIIPYKGVYASLLDLDYIHQMIHLRIKIETQVIMDFILSDPDPFVIEELEHTIRKQLILINQSKIDRIEFYNMDSAMHSIWFNHQRCSGIWDLIQQQEIHYTRFKLLDVLESQKYREITDNHIELLQAIKTRNTTSIEDILCRHLNGGLRRMGQKVLQEYRSYFKIPQDQVFWSTYYKQYLHEKM